MTQADAAWIGAVTGIALGIGNLVLLWWNVRRAGNFSLRVSQISRDTKISEFRQAWIKELREDIAAYAAASDLWMKQYDYVNGLKKRGVGVADDTLRKEHDEMNNLANKALQIYWRIRLRINPLDTSKTKERDDKFLLALYDLLNPGKQRQDHFDSDWRKNANEAIELGRVILKEEWEVTKKGESNMPSL